MQPEFQTDFQMITHQPGNTAMGSKAGSLKRNNTVKSQDKCFLGMLTDMEKTPHENILDLEKLQENSQNGGNITDVLLRTEQNSFGNEEKPLIPMISETDKNTITATSKAEIESGFKKSALGEMLKITGMTEDNESNTWQEKLNKNSRGFQISNGIKGDVGNEVKAQLLNGFEAEIAKMIKDPETTSKNGDGQNRPAEAGAQLLKGMGVEISKLIKNLETIDKNADGQIRHVGAKAQILNGFEAEIAKMIKDPETTGKNADGQNGPAEVGAQLLKGMGVEISKLIKNLETTDKNAEAQMKNASDIRDLKKTAATERILSESKTFKENVEELKILNPPHLFDEKLKESELNKKELLQKISTGIQEKEQESDLSKRDNTSDKKASQSDKEFINLKDAGLKVKVSGSGEFSGVKINGGESESKDNGIMLSKSGTGDKSFEEIMFSKENRLSSTISRAGTLNQIVEKAAIGLKNGKSQARVELKPEFLGSVRMKITTENHLVRVRILTELPIVKEMIESNISQLKTDLQSHGLSIDKLDVSVANDSQQHGKSFEKAENLPEQENNDVSDNGDIVAEETRTVNLLKEDITDDRLDFFA